MHLIEFHDTTHMEENCVTQTFALNVKKSAFFCAYLFAIKFKKSNFDCGVLLT